MASGHTTRRRQDKPRRNFGRPFGLAMALVLAFALVYTVVFSDNLYLVPGDNELIVAFLDVGQGDSILIWSRDNAILIDGGDFAQGDTVLRYIRQAGISRLDYVIATHPHSDHIGGLIPVLSRVEVGYVIMADVVHTTTTFENFIDTIANAHIPVVIPEVGERFRAGIIDFTVVGPLPGHGNLNDASIVLRLRHGDTSFLFTGDAEAASERAMMASGLELRADVLKVGHHGSRTSSTAAFLDAVGPVAAVIPVGGGNQFGHPHGEVLERFGERGILVYRTDLNGTVFMGSDGVGIVVIDGLGR